MFNHNDIMAAREASTIDKVRAMRLLMEGNASPPMASIARGILAELTGFYNTNPPGDRHIEAIYEARRIGAVIYDLSFQTVAEIDALERTSEEEPFPEEG